MFQMNEPNHDRYIKKKKKQKIGGRIKNYFSLSIIIKKFLAYQNTKNLTPEPTDYQDIKFIL